MTSYEDMLKQGRKDLPELVLKKSRFEIPKVKGHIQGNKTIISNFRQVAQTLGRDPNHILKYLLKELATPGDLKSTGLLIGTKVSANLVNTKIKAYTDKYVLCKECGKPDTELSDEKGIFFLRCKACGAKYPVNK
jgi:translation initiation factor 2 subunit 2